MMALIGLGLISFSVLITALVAYDATKVAVYLGYPTPTHEAVVVAILLTLAALMFYIGLRLVRSHPLLSTQSD